MKKINCILRVIVIAHLIIFIGFNIILMLYSLVTSNYDVIDNLYNLLSVFLSIILLNLFYKYKSYTNTYFQKIMLVSVLLFITPLLKTTLNISDPINLYYVLIVNITTCLTVLSTLNICIESKYEITSINISKKLYLFLYSVNTLLFSVIVVLLSRAFIMLNIFQYF